MPLSGCRWSTCGAVDEAVHRGVDRRCRAAVYRGDRSRTRRPSRPRAARPDRRRRAPAARSTRSTARPSSVSVPRSPPEPFTHISSTSRPVTGIHDPCPSPRCCRPRSSCCAGRRRAGSTARAVAATTGFAVTLPTRPGCRRLARPTMRSAYPLRAIRLTGSAGSRRPRATPTARRARRCRTHPSSRRCPPSTSPARSASASATRSTSSARAIISCTLSTERI